MSEYGGVGGPTPPEIVAGRGLVMVDSSGYSDNQQTLSVEPLDLMRMLQENSWRWEYSSAFNNLVINSPSLMDSVANHLVYNDQFVERMLERLAAKAKSDKSQPEQKEIAMILTGAEPEVWDDL